MGFLSGLGGLVSPGLTAATNTVSAYQGAQANAAKQQQAQAIQQITLLRQQHQQEIEDALKKAQTAKATRDASILGLGMPGYTDAERALSGAKVEGETPGLVAREGAMGPVKTANAVAQESALIPGKVAEQNALTPGAARRAGAVASAEVAPHVEQARETADYAAPVSAVDPVTHETKFYTRSDALGKTKAAAAGGGMTGQTMLAAGRIGMSYNDLKQAVSQMEEFEKDPKNLAKFTPNARMIGEVSQATPNMEGHGMTAMVGNAGTALMSGHAQSYLADKDPALQTYLYNKQRVGTALTELLPRPNQQLLGIEKGLSGIEVGGNPAVIHDVQLRRRAGLGMLEAIMAKGGITAGGEPSVPTATPPTPRATTGDVDLRAPKAALPPLTKADRIRAAKDPGFAAWLKSQGIQ